MEVYGRFLEHLCWCFNAMPSSIFTISNKEKILSSVLSSSSTIKKFVACVTDITSKR